MFTLTVTTTVPYAHLACYYFLTGGRVQREKETRGKQPNRDKCHDEISCAEVRGSSERVTTKSLSRQKANDKSSGKNNRTGEE